jgi:alkylated DNA repair protein alkB family protein 4
MTAVSEKRCACKGIRSCLLCEKQGEHHRVHIVHAKDYVYCTVCKQAWSGDLGPHNHPSHSGSSVTFPGIEILPDFVSEDEESNLCAEIDQKDWTASQSGRRKQDFGPKVNFKKQKVRLSSFTGFPSYSRLLIDRFAQHPLLANFTPVELCNLEYIPERGSAIDPHFDDWWLWGERLVTLNLLSPIVETFTCSDCPEVSVAVYVPRRSLIIVGGPARYKWMHAIHRDSIRSRRIAMTFRELSQEFCMGGPNENIGHELTAIAQQYST